MPEAGLRVKFLDQTGAKMVEAVIAGSVTSREIISSLITRMNLPVVGPDGGPVKYTLDHREGGKRLLAGQTLQDAGVKEGDHLVIFPEIIAAFRHSPPRAE